MSLQLLDDTGLNHAIRAVARATQKTDEHCSRLDQGHNEAQLVALRRRAQWLSLNVQQKLYTLEATKQVSRQDRHVHEITRLALLIYNNMMVYPVPPARGSDTRLALALKCELETALLLDEYPGICDDYPGLILWAVLLGGISDSKDSERHWYKHQFRRVLSISAFQSLQWWQLEEHLRSFMWQRYVLNHEGCKFWIESCALR
jgi:hypothetical protein